MKRKKSRHFRWWIIILLVVAAAVITGILLGSDKKKIVNGAKPGSESSGMENTEGPPAQKGQTITMAGKRLSPEGKIQPPEKKILSPEGKSQPPEELTLSPAWKIRSPDGQIIPSEGYRLSPDDQIISPEGRRLSPEWKIMSPDGHIVSPEGYRLSPEGQTASPEEQRLSSEDFSETPLLALPKREENDCLPIRKDLDDFFTYLDGRDYVQRLKPGIDTRAWFRDLVRTLSSTPPQPSGEGLDLQVMARNIFHFYRILDKNDIRLVIEILSNEKEALEMNLDLFFEWSCRKTHCPDPDQFRPSETALYRYAGFFLNTIGGRSYLYRRSSVLRVLITYYAVLIIHDMDKKGANTYGIDPVPYIAPLAREVTMQNDLHFQNEYLQRLTELSDYYANRR